MDYQCTAIVLKSFKLNEADKILHLYSKEHGPLQCIAKGAYRVNSKFSSKAQVLNCLDLLVASGRNLDIVKEARLVKSFPNINSNYEALTLACFMLEILAHIAIQDEHYEELFDLVNGYLTEINNSCSTPDNTKLFFITCKSLWELICMLGYKPDLDTCSLTNAKRNSNEIPQYFDLENGCVTSTRAYKQMLSTNPYQDSIRELKPGVFNTLLHLDQKLNADQATLNIEQTLKFLHKHIEYRLHKDFKSWKLIEPLLEQQLMLAA